MTAPRQVLRGATHFVTRRTLRGKFLLRPGTLTNQLFEYLLAVAAERFHVRLHVYCMMSNHYHLLLTDPLANLPAFEQYVDGLMGRALNALYGLDQTVWDPDGYSSLALASAEDVIDKAAYALANPVAAGLVRAARKWPGPWSAPRSIGAAVTIARPAHFFSPKGDMPERATLELCHPPGFASAADFASRLEPVLEAKEEEARRSRTTFLGVARVLKQRVLDRAPLPRPKGSLKPRVAAKDIGLRVELLRRLMAFLAAHRESLLEWRAGRRDVVFPVGTYQMRVLHNANCAGAG